MAAQGSEAVTNRYLVHWQTPAGPPATEVDIVQVAKTTAVIYASWGLSLSAGFTVLMHTPLLGDRQTITMADTWL